MNLNYARYRGKMQ